MLTTTGSIIALMEMDPDFSSGVMYSRTEPFPFALGLRFKKRNIHYLIIIWIM
jgi:hypothetical protein